MNTITSSCHQFTRLRAILHTSLQVSLTKPMGFGNSPFPFHSSLYPDIPRLPIIASAKKKDSQTDPLLNPSIIEELSMDVDEDDILIEEDELLEDDGYFEDDYFEEEAEPSAGDGAGGGGISLAGTAWDKNALEIAEEVALSFDGELGIYAFRSLLNATIQVRIERLTNKSGSPSMPDIEAFSKTYKARLDEAEASGNIPGNISLEVSSPGVERVVRVPQDLERFKDRNLYVKYVTQVLETGSSSEHDGVFRLISYDTEANTCTWGLADVRINREKAGKGRPLSKKQKEWRLNTTFDSLRVVRFFPDI